MASHPALDIRWGPASDAPTLLDLIYAELDRFAPVAIQEHDSAGGLRVFFARASERDAAREAVSQTLGARLDAVGAVDVDDEDWARRSQAQLGAVRAGIFIVAPPWDPVAARVSSQAPPPRDTCGVRLQPDQERAERLDDARHLAGGAGGPTIVIAIEPSMGFGTGHHATTRLCLELLQEVDVRGGRVVDVGTGSGLLAIAAAALGAASVVAIDSDPDALRNARDNAAANGVDAVVAIREADLGALDLPPADIVLANLTGAALVRFAPALRALAAPGGRLIVSGFSPEELEGVARAIDLPAVREARDGDWCAAVFARHLESPGA